MKIIIAPDSFKGSCSTIVAAQQIEQGFRRIFPDVEAVQIPIADGGEGTVEAMILGAGGTIHTCTVTGPMGQPVEAQFGILADGTGVVELAAASGLPLVPEDQRDPAHATTYGTGQLILEALKAGCKRIMIGLGGSATNDGGVGLAQALGVSFRDAQGYELEFGGAALAKLHTIDMQGITPLLADAQLMIASDVDNPLCGPHGASHVFGPQKGADVNTVKQLDAALEHYAQVLKQQLNQDIASLPGAGAAGGTTASLVALFGAVIRPGIQVVLDMAHFDEHVRQADLVITGEGRIDGQSIHGKVPVGVAQRAKQFGVPVLAIVGDIGPGAEACYEYGIDAILSTVNKAMPLQEAMEHSSELMLEAAERAARIVHMGMTIGGNK